ncbi:O-antigen ligase [Chitinophaga sp. Cy-1792]|uniref:O-antigen ligase family protein n=1 Tax=Chitinophaga sp. Cy-1792 TaxID=2608339 RepID=UPI001420A900|nr:O-antigen ligase family protein [Chitinophaga sp. Cy-1792]NIG53354.1 hypothetical protein [Chitinophaga sp. Cy-1792]
MTLSIPGKESVSKWAQLLNNSVIVISWTLAILFFTIRYCFSFNFELYITDHYYLYTIYPLVLIMLAGWYFRIGTGFYPNMFLLIIISVLSCLLLFSTYYSFANEYFSVITTLFLLYFLLEKAGPGIFNLVILLFAGMFLFQLGKGLWQLYQLNMEEVNFSDGLWLTGTLQNSGVYAIYLVVHLPIMDWLLRQRLLEKYKDQKIIKISVYSLYIILAITAGILVALSKSRTALLLLTALGTIIISGRYAPVINVCFKKLSWLSKCLLLSFLTILISAGCYYIFMLKAASAYGRVMKWQIASAHIYEHLWTGTGVGRFTWYYPQWQAQYFLEHGSSSPQTIASSGESYIIFNEFLQLLNTVGIPGMLVVVVFLFNFYKASSKAYQQQVKMIKLTTTLILISSCTSYPFHVNVFMLLLALCFAFVFSVSEKRTPLPNFKKLTSTALSYLLLTIAFLLLLFTTGSALYTMHAKYQWDKLKYLSPSPALTAEYEKLQRELPADGKLLTCYGENLLLDSATNSKAVIVLESARKYFISKRTIEKLGQAYYNTGQYDKALEVYQWLGYYLPSRFIPKYKEMNLLLQMKDTLNCRKVARYITEMPVKVPSAEVDSIKSAAARILQP